jgi:hypothetical protein
MTSKSQRKRCSILKQRNISNNEKSKSIKKKVQFSNEINVREYESQRFKELQFQHYIVSNYSMTNSDILCKYSLYNIEEMDELSIY